LIGSPRIRRLSRVTKFGKLEVRIYGDVAIVNGSVIAADGDASA